ncbi:MAG TPA: hypothetical protein VE178_00715 [Silvibacterium sp.]|nr:hypothetical protein [Silvibacterium sp.]
MMTVDKARSHEFLDITDIYDRFSALTVDSLGLGGSLLVYAGLDWSGIALTFAANVAGAASLGLEQDLGRAKAAVRNGACDFLVNTLDEALRILKNEIRKKNPVAVALVGDPREAVAEMVERGVQPEIIAGDVKGPLWRGGSMERLVERGARRLDSAVASGRLVSWKVEREPQRWLPVLDRIVADLLDPADKNTPARRRWLEAAPRYLGRALAHERCVRMSAAEWDRLAETRGNEDGWVPVVVILSRS